MHATVRTGLGMLAGLLTSVASGQPVRDDISLILPQVPVRESPVSVESVDVETTIEAQVATTVVRMALRNPTGRVQESQVVMPVALGAVVREFVLEGLGEEGIAEILPRDEARRAYEQIVAKLRDPGLLEFAGQGLMKSSVFPVPANGEQVVSLTYEQILVADGDRVDYSFPRSSSLAQSGVTWTFGATIESDRPIATVYSPTHDLLTERVSPTKVRVRVPASAAASGTMAISYLMEAADGVSASLVAYPDPDAPGGGYFLLLAGLSPVAPEDAKTVKREVTLVIDRSGSMRGEKLEQVREAAMQILAGLEDGEAFNIIDYSDSIESFADAPVIKTEASMEEAKSYLGQLKAVGGTNIHDALLEALRPEPREDFLPMVLFLTDGLPTVGVRSETAIRDAVASSNAFGRRIFTFGVGNDVNAPLLTNIATTSRATTTFVLPEEDVEAKVGQVFGRLSGPVLAAPGLAIVDGARGERRLRDVLPATLPDLFEGDQLVVLGKYTPGMGDRLELVLTGEYFGDPRTFEFSFDVSKATAKNGYVPRLWANRKIGQLINEIRQAGADGQMPGEEPAIADGRMKELVDEIVRLSIRWGILTDYTAFLAVPEAELAGRLRETRAFEELGAAPSSREANRALASDSLGRSQLERAGGEAVRQEKNVQAGLNAQNVAAGYPVQLGDLLSMTKDAREPVEVVRQVADQTFFNRSDRWVQAELVEVDDPKVDETVEFGSEAYDRLVDALIEEGRAGVLAMRGDILLVRGGRNVLVKGSEEGGK